MQKEILSIPAGGTYHLIRKYHIHAFPHPRTYDYSNLVTFRKKGGVMEELFRVEQTITLNMNDENLYDHLIHFDDDLQDRIKNYIVERKRDFVFERPEFMFWVLKKEEDLLHKPETIQPYNSHVYFTYQELRSGQKKVRIASRQLDQNVVDPVWDLLRDFEQIDKKDMTHTEKEQLIKARIGQSAFKQGLLKKETKCKLCSVMDERLLIASHIKPWKDCNDKERLDLNNGLLLCPNHDWLFDKGYISFADKGDILITETLDELTRIFMNLNENMRITLNDDQRGYMNWHRNNLFNK